MASGPDTTVYLRSHRHDQVGRRFNIDRYQEVPEEDFLEARSSNWKYLYQSHIHILLKDVLGHYLDSLCGYLAKYN